MRYLFVAEKPSVARTVEAVYKKNQKEIEQKIGEIDFIALAGHVCRYMMPDEYSQWHGQKWAEVELPMVPDPFVIVPIEGDRYKKVIDNIKKMIKENDYDGFIVATDSDTEGNGIYHNLEKYLKIDKKKALRFFESSMAEKDIMHSLYNMTDFHQNLRDIRMTEQYIIRSHFDWLVGMNATRAVTLKLGRHIRVGRVKAPTLKLVYDNCKAIDEFVPHSDYQVKATYEEGFTGIYVDDQLQPVNFETPEKAQFFIDMIEGERLAKVSDVTRKKVSTPPPQLYKLSALQIDAGAKFNYDPQKTLDLVQSLYEKQYVSYPRTDGVYVSSAKAEDFPQLVETVMHVDELSLYADNITPEDIERVQKNKRVVNDEEVQKSSHDALLPTVMPADYGKLSKDEINVYELICRRFVAQFMPDMVETKTVLYADIDEYKFKSTGSTVVENGWSILYDKKQTAEQIPENIKNGDELNVQEYSVHEKVSKPPKRFTAASLIEAMEGIAKYIDDKDLKKVMKDAKGIGTQATRGTIVNELISSGYIESKTKANSLYITDTGKAYIESIADFSIIKPEGAAMWETMFQGVKEGSVSYPDANERTLSYVNEFVREVENLKVEPIKRASSNVLDVKCPYCGKDIIRFNWGYACEDSKSKVCKFSVSNFGGKVKDSDIKQLVTKGETKVIKAIGTSQKTNKPFDAKLILQNKGEQYVTKYGFPPRKD